MVQSDQIRPLAPASDRQDDHTQTTKKKPILKSRRIRLSIIITATILIIIAIVIIALRFTIFNIKNPVINLNQVSLNPINLTNTFSFSSFQNLSLRAQVSVKNPNHASFKFGNTVTNLYYHGTEIGEARGPGGQAKARRTMHINETVEVAIGQFLRNPSFVSDLRSLLLPVSSYTRVGGRIKVMSFVKRHVTVSLNCSFVVNLTSQSIQEQRCSRKVKW